MSHIDSSGGAAVLVRATDAELVGFPPKTVRLLADSSSTGRRLSAQRVTLPGGADGANPRHHAAPAELFYMLSGAVQLLAGDRLLVAGERGPRRRATRTAPRIRRRGSDADLLIVITPGIERFEYFRHPARITTGQQPPRSLLEVQALYDTFFDDGRPGGQPAAAIGRVRRGQPGLTNGAPSRRLP